MVDAMKAAYPEVRTDEYHIDILTAQFVLHPDQFNLVVASNLIGDILSALGPAYTGTIGIAHSGNVTPNRNFPSLVEPVHGSAPDIAGKGIANPLGQIWSVAMMLDHLGEAEAGPAMERVWSIRRHALPTSPVTPTPPPVARPWPTLWTEGRQCAEDEAVYGNYGVISAGKKPQLRLEPWFGGPVYPLSYPQLFGALCPGSAHHAPKPRKAAIIRLRFAHLVESLHKLWPDRSFMGRSTHGRSTEFAHLRY